MSSKNGKPRTVPKFGSFKPKPTPQPDPESISRSDTRQTVRDDELRHSKRHKSSHEDVERDQHKSRRRMPPDDARSLVRMAVGSPSKVKDPADELFTFDKRGDPLIRRYRGNDRSRVPAFRRIGRGIILGTKGYLEIRQDGASEKFSIRSERDRGSAFRDRNLLAQAKNIRARRFKKYAEQTDPTANEDFIALEPSKKRKRGEDHEAGSSSDRERPTYRSIEGKAKPYDDSDSEFDSDNDDDDAESYYMTPAKRRSIGLSRTVKEHPDDIRAWLVLIGLQDELFRENEENDHIRTRDETKALADIKVSMFEKALHHTASTRDREEVLAGLMGEGSRIWNSQILAKRWADVTEQNPESFALWKSRMDFELGNIATFTYEGIRQRFIDRLRYLEAKLAGNVENEARRRSLAEEAVYVFLRLTRFLQEAGFVDLAVGAWQAILELHMCRAHIAQDSRESAMNSLGAFWESEVPRIGEPGATGWRKFVEDQSMADFLPEGRQQEPRKPPQTRDVYKAWAATELQRALEARMPSRTVDEGTEDDPYRVVLFADIEPLLLFLPSSVLQSVCPQILDSYLLFCHLPPAFGTGDTIKSAINDPFVYETNKDIERSICQQPAATDLALERNRQPPTFMQDGSRMSITPEVLFPGSGWFSYLASWRKLYPERDEPIQLSHILMTVRQLVRLFGVEELGEYHMALEWLNDPAGAKKVAKAVLKQYPSNVRLYNAYALVEWANGNLDTAQKVLLSATTQQLAASWSGGQLLRNNWAWLEIESNKKSKALSRLCHSVDQDHDPTVSPSLVLKAKSELSSKRDFSLSAGSSVEATEYAKGLALLDYLSPSSAKDSAKEPQSEDQGDIIGAMTAIQAFSSELSSRGLEQTPTHERFLQFAARLLYFHATHGPFRPVYIRHQLHRFVTLFPQNTIFLSVFAWAESSLRIDDPVRGLLRNLVLAESHDCLSSRMFAIRYELQVGNVHSVKAAFEAAVESEFFRGNPLLWLYYIRFCHNWKELKSKAKDIFYRAIAACPGSKKLYMEAFTTLVKDMSSSELKAVFSTVSSKGLRVHVDLDDFLKR